jgi:hypothetical protein
MKTPLVEMKIFEDQISIIENEGSSSRIRSIAPEGLAQALVKDLRFDTGLLPVGTIRYFKYNGNIRLYCVIPAHKRRIKYNSNGNKREYEAVPLPPSLFVFKIHENGGSFQLQDTYIYALTSTIVKPNSRVYKFPMTNIFPDGRICMGYHEFPTNWNSLVGVTGFCEQFFSSEFNDDLDDLRFKPFKIIKNEQCYTIERVHALVKHLSGLENFPYENLHQIGSFEDIKRRIGG